jgi:hypothetical protein
MYDQAKEDQRKARGREMLLKLWSSSGESSSKSQKSDSPLPVRQKSSRSLIPLRLGTRFGRRLDTSSVSPFLRIDIISSQIFY